MSTSSVFEKYRRKNYPHVFEGTIHLDSIAGGVPLNPDVLEYHLKSKTGASDDLVRAQVAEIMMESDGASLDEAIEKAAKLKSLTGFRKDKNGCYIMGYQLKKCLREAALIAASEKRIPQKWGGASDAGKALKSWFPEHVFVLEDKLYLGVDEPSEVAQSFVHKIGPRGPVSAIQNTEIIYGADLTFTIETDYEFTDEQWAAIWTTAEHSGLGAARAQGFGTFSVTKWDAAKARLRKAA